MRRWAETATKAKEVYRADLIYMAVHDRSIYVFTNHDTYHPGSHHAADSIPVEAVLVLKAESFVRPRFGVFFAF